MVHDVYMGIASVFSSVTLRYCVEMVLHNWTYIADWWAHQFCSVNRISITNSYDNTLDTGAVEKFVILNQYHCVSCKWCMIKKHSYYGVFNSRVLVMTISLPVTIKGFSSNADT